MIVKVRKGRLQQAMMMRRFFADNENRWKCGPPDRFSAMLADPKPFADNHRRDHPRQLGYNESNHT